MNDKIVITNRSALQRKYGAGMQKILEAVARLVIADDGRVLHTRLIMVDDAVEMSAVRGR